MIAGVDTQASDSGWLIPVVVAAMIASAGYVGRLIVDELRAWRSSRRDDLARLLSLQALLTATRAAFLVQRALAERLSDMLRRRIPEELPTEPGLERLFSALYDRFNPGEQDLHSVIRGYTVHALRPVNRAISDWLATDSTHRTVLNKRNNAVELAQFLNRLDAHLLLWHAKYEAWIPEAPEHALVYSSDEEQHGLSFPQGIEGVLDRVIERRQR